MHRFPTRRERGFTLIELMVTVAIVAILGSVALPSYTAYLQRSRVPVALDGLSSFSTRMEQRFQDTGAYDCGLPVPTPANFALTCALGSSNQSYTATATGSGQMNGYVYTIDSLGNRATAEHPRGRNAACWSTKGTVCDS